MTRTEPEDLHTLFRFQLDEEANFLAAFTPEDPSDKRAYMEKYSRLVTDPTVRMRTIRRNDEIVGSIARFFMDNDAEITYWIDRQVWGQGIATTALRDFLKLETIRPIHGRVAFDNYGSQRVLEKNGFVKVGTNTDFANARQANIEEYIYELR